MNFAFAASGVTVAAPFLHDDVIDLMTNIHPRHMACGSANKPLLAAAVRGIAPAWLFERSDKGEYSRDLFEDLRGRRESFRSFMANSYLVDHKYLDPDRVTRALDAPQVDTGPLFALEQIAAVERWVRRNA